MLLLTLFVQLLTYLINDPVYKCSHDVLDVLRNKIVLNFNSLPLIPNSCNYNLALLLIDYSVKPLLNAQLNKVNRFEVHEVSQAQRRRQRV